MGILSDDTGVLEGQQMHPTTTREELEAKAARVDEQKLVRKLDWYIIPLVMALYLFSFLDR